MENSINQFRQGYVNFECHTSMLCIAYIAFLNHSCVTVYIQLQNMFDKVKRRKRK